MHPTKNRICKKTGKSEEDGQDGRLFYPNAGKEMVESVPIMSDSGALSAITRVTLTNSVMAQQKCNVEKLEKLHAAHG